MFGIVKVCEDGKMVLKRRTDLAEDSKIRTADSQGRNIARFNRVRIITGQIAPGEEECIATETSS